MRAIATRTLLVVGIVLHNPCAAVWLADGHTLRQTEPFTGQTMAALPVPRIAALAGTHDGGVWALSERELLLAGANDRPPLHIDITSAGYGDGVLLAIDPFDSSAWVATSQRLLLHYATTG
ncbi:MAG TPA: hypothetical protein VFO33_06115, partial [Casimicrobiaceae bacterium]|nr:hypothetical protein [Casimicrobiaceae bacterium]